jgi:hypothetical protein
METWHLPEETTLQQATETCIHIEVMFLENTALIDADGQIRTGHLIGKYRLKEISKTFQQEVIYLLQKK